MIRLTILTILLTAFYSFRAFGQINTDSVRYNITVSSTDLSEDMSSLSSGNDELILFIYEKDSPNYSPPLIQKEFVFDKKKQSQNFQLDLGFESSKDLIFILIERDSRSSLKRIEAITRLYLFEIKKLFDAKQTVELEEFLGDEDILFFCNIDLQGALKSSCKQGYINNLDTYSYEVKVKTK